MDAVEATKAELIRAVGVRMRSDVPVAFAKVAELIQIVLQSQQEN